MRIKLVFDDWRDKNNHSVYATEQGVALSNGDFHSGTTFEATIETDDAEWLREQLARGFVPVFYAVAAQIAKDADAMKGG